MSADIDTRHRNPRLPPHKTRHEKISSRIKIRPEYDKAVTFAQEIKTAAPDQPVIHELKRPARNAAELIMGAMLFAVLAVAAQLDRNYIREKTLEGQAAAEAKGNHGGRPKVIDEGMLTFARALRDKGTPIPEIATKLIILTARTLADTPPNKTPEPDNAPDQPGGI